MDQRIMKILTVTTLALAVVAGGSVLAAAPADGVMATIKTFLDDFNKGDMAGAAATQAADVAIIDEFPPHAWHGPTAFKDWTADLEKDAKAHGQTSQKVTLGRTVRNQVDGDTAYVVMAATFTYKEKGKAMVEPAQMAFALRKDAGAWKIAAWTWAGTTPHS
jgi:ketosteroid isomerase-like protein